MGVVPEAVARMRKLALLKNRANLKSSDEDALVSLMNLCCAHNPHCTRRQECHELWNVLAGAIPLIKKPTVPEPRRVRTLPGSWIPQLKAREVLANARSN